MEKIVIWGCGGMFDMVSAFLEELEDAGEIHIVAVVNNRPHEETTVGKWKIIYAEELKRMDFDRIVITANWAYESIKADIKNMNIDTRVSEIWEYLRDKMLLMDAWDNYNMLWKKLILKQAWRL